MSEVRCYRDLAIEIRAHEVARLLGYSDRPVPERVRELLDVIETEMAPLVEPACAILWVGSDVLARSPFLKHMEAAALCLVTIGAGVEEQMDAYERNGEIGKALMVNVYGSAAAEAAADAANQIIRDEVAAEGLRCTRRFSPGYSGWDVSEQRWILPALQAHSLGVSLTEGCMMVPRKSITFAVNIGENPVEVRDDNACDGCELINCKYRRETVIREENGKKWTAFIAPNSDYCPLDRWS